MSRGLAVGCSAVLGMLAGVAVVVHRESSPPLPPTTAAAPPLFPPRPSVTPAPPLKASVPTPPPPRSSTTAPTALALPTPAPSAGAVSPFGDLSTIAVRGTVFATSGNWAFRDFLQNVVLTLHEAVPGAVPVVAMLDNRGAGWCQSALSARCAFHPCPCPYSKSADLSAEGYTGCLLGIYVCKLRVKLAILNAGYDVFFIDADAAPRGDVLSRLGTPPVAAVGACEHCLGTCALQPEVARLIDFPQKGAVPLAGYWQLNIGMIWLNHSDPDPAGALRESIGAIVKHKLDFKSVDQTVFNRRLMARRAVTRCLPQSEGGLNVRGRSSRPKKWPTSWGVHAARLVSRDGFYKRALLWHNGLWRANTTAEFLDLAREWQAKPSQVKK
eukprot:Hpha_TRINITY_DN20609_c0_g1::TRINITY_DN20609_c0_g1_i1::g.148162::m.148162